MSTYGAVRGVKERDEGSRRGCFRSLGVEVGRGEVDLAEVVKGGCSPAQVGRGGGNLAEVEGAGLGGHTVAVGAVGATARDAADTQGPKPVGIPDLCTHRPQHISLPVPQELDSPDMPPNGWEKTQKLKANGIEGGRDGVDMCGCRQVHQRGAPIEQHLQFPVGGGTRSAHTRDPIQIGMQPTRTWPVAIQA